MTWELDHRSIAESMAVDDGVIAPGSHVDFDPLDPDAADIDQPWFIIDGVSKSFRDLSWADMERIVEHQRARVRVAERHLAELDAVIEAKARNN